MLFDRWIDVLPHSLLPVLFDSWVDYYCREGLKELSSRLECVIFFLGGGGAGENLRGGA